QHQLNILNLIGELLGRRIKELSDLEAALLILSAFYHDIGMVFSKEERENLRNEEYFEEFISTFPGAKLSISDSNEMSIDIAEWYCRWSHARRVWHYLDELESSLKWEGTSIRKEIAEICLSHNENAEYLKNNKFETNFWGNADLRFCSIILRLADLLDFDNSRSPESVFEFLKLDKQQTYREKVSYDEWKKHLASRGFSFNKWSKSIPYEIDFKAAPTHPAVENDIREFLDVIELELRKCSTIVRFCSNQWNNFILPDRIIRDNIRSQGYKFGNYKFSLDQNQVLDLLMGENLYAESYIFVRELLQNSIDSSRHREFHEHLIGNKDFKVRPIEVSSWIDNDGYRWFRIDEYGMGMTDSIINKYFLKVGNSYYNSDEFKVRKIEYLGVNNVDFTPISRFGIGILSCFIIGDQVEVNTLSIDCDGKDIHPIRLSLKGLHNFYVMQTDKDNPHPMPIEGGVEAGFRKEVGTSIAVRFKINKDPLYFDLYKILNMRVFNPAVDVLLKDVGYIAQYPEIIKKNWCTKQTFSLPDNEKNNVMKFLGLEKQPDIKLHLIPLDLSKASPNANLKGQIVIILLDTDIDIDKGNIYFWGEEEDVPKYYRWDFRYTTQDDHGNEKLQLFLNLGKPGLGSEQGISIDISFILEKISVFNTKIPFYLSHNNLILSHNGITIPNKHELFDKSSSGIDLRIEDHYKFKSIFSIGLIELKDELRPSLSLSRNRIISVSWNLISQLNYTIRKSLHQIEDIKLSTDDTNFISLNNITVPESLYEELLKDKLVTDNRFWANEKIIECNNKNFSVRSIVTNHSETEIEIPYIYSNFSGTLYRTLLQKYCSLKIQLFKKTGNDGKPIYNNKKYFASRKSEVDDLHDLALFPPLTFITYQNFTGLVPGRMCKDFLNINHPYSKWLIKAQSLLHNNYSA
ncbi:MAG: hypothetical protein QQN41_05660, partial [Nitrosopumilus sp.]